MAEESRRAEPMEPGAASAEKTEWESVEALVAENNRLREEKENLEQAVVELKSKQEQTLRTAAYYENLRRRTDQELNELRRYGHESLARKLLAVADSLERALAAANGTDQVVALREGVDLVLKQLNDALASEGVSPVTAVGERFDPNLHEAIGQQATSEAEADTVVAELQRGYLLNGRLLRPAIVLVAVPPEQVDDAPPDEPD
jgi:molecular chaperone GrpE